MLIHCSHDLRFVFLIITKTPPSERRSSSSAILLVNIPVFRIKFNDGLEVRSDDRMYISNYMSDEHKKIMFNAIDNYESTPVGPTSYEDLY